MIGLSFKGLVWFQWKVY